MCISIIFAANLAETETVAFTEKLEELGKVYNYGIGIGPEKLQPKVSDKLPALLCQPQVLFEVHDLAEQHCACDIDQDIRNGSGTGIRSKFFDFVSEIIQIEKLLSLSVIFFEEELPDATNIRRAMGGISEFVDMLNRWNTWQTERFEPIRQAYEIADSTPLYFTFSEKKFNN